MKSFTLIPDWHKPKYIGLVWPEDLEDMDTRCLVNFFYIDLIQLLINELPEDISLTIIHRKGEEARLQNYFGQERVKLIENDKIQDIWIRDFAPFWKSSGEYLFLFLAGIIFNLVHTTDTKIQLLDVSYIVR